MTGGVIETFETPYTKSQMIGGRQPVRKGSKKMYSVSIIDILGKRAKIFWMLCW